ncbi:MAG TPA: hypothetical protein VER08_00315 [Pyrinomonadaceae bacterium]|nr:hypothetical protein [Pyrinomonadaceae bacterium]
MQTRSTRLALAALFTAALAVSAPLTRTAGAQANTTTTNQTITLSNVVVNTCDGNSVTLSGKLHLVHHFTVSNSGSTNMTMHSNYEEVQGVGNPSLTLYRGVSSNTHKSHSNGTTPQTNFTNVDRVRLISLGPSENLIINVTTHTTVNSNGQATSTFANASAECNG